MTRPQTSPPKHNTLLAAPRDLTVSLHRVRRGRAVAFAAEGPVAEPPPSTRPSRAAQMLAIAHDFQRLIDSGEVPDRAVLAAQIGLTRARITQIMDLLLLAPDIQAAILVGLDTSGTERQFRRVARHLDWADQRRNWRPANAPADGRRT